MSKAIGITKELLYRLYIVECRSAPKIAKVLGCSTRTVYTYMNKYNISTQHNYKSNKAEKYRYNLNKEFLLQEYIDNKKSVRTIAREQDCGRETVRNYLNIHDIELRRSWDCRLGSKHTEESKKKISNNRVYLSGEDHPNYGKYAALDPNWKGNNTELTNRIRSLALNTHWKKEIFKRDNYKCVLCNGKRSPTIHADHIMPLSYILSKYGITTVKEATECSKLWDTDNGRTLCARCHRETDTWGGGARNYVPD